MGNGKERRLQAAGLPRQRGIPIKHAGQPNRTEVRVPSESVFIRVHPWLKLRLHIGARAIFSRIWSSETVMRQLGKCVCIFVRSLM